MEKLGRRQEIILREAVRRYTRFHSTEEAVKFGKTATTEDVEDLKKARSIYLLRYKRLSRKKTTMENLNIMSSLATRAQFCREALEVSREVPDDV